MKKVLTVTALAVLLLGAVSAANAATYAYQGTSDVWGDFWIYFNSSGSTFSGTWYYSAGHYGNIEGDVAWDNAYFWSAVDGVWYDNGGPWGGSLEGTFGVQQVGDTCSGNVYQDNGEHPEGTFFGYLVTIIP
jgi:hypothetical protein